MSPGCNLQVIANCAEAISLAIITSPFVASSLSVEGREKRGLSKGRTSHRVSGMLSNNGAYALAFGLVQVSEPPAKLLAQRVQVQPIFWAGRVRASRRSSVVVFASILPSRRMWATSLPRSARRQPTRRQRWQVRGSCSEHISDGRVRAAISSTPLRPLGEHPARRHLLVIGDASFAEGAAEFAHRGRYLESHLPFRT